MVAAHQRRYIAIPCQAGWDVVPNNANQLHARKQACEPHRKRYCFDPGAKGRLLITKPIFSSRTKKLAIVTIVCLLVVRLCGTPAYAQLFPPQSGTAQFDPSKCSTDSGGKYYYFALGRHVFRQPIDNPAVISVPNGPEYLASLPRPPIPADPVGCPGHPLQVSHYGFSHFVSTTNGQPSSASRNADHFKVGLNNSTFVGTQDELFQMCQTKDHRDTSVPGFIGCIISGCGITPTCYYSRVYQTVDHLSPDAAKMTLLCEGGVDLRPFPIGCQGGYKLYADVAIYYGFDPRKIPLEASLEAETAFRRRLHAAEIADYQWSPSTPTDKQDR